MVELRSGQTVRRHVDAVRRTDICASEESEQTQHLLHHQHHLYHLHLHINLALLLEIELALSISMGNDVVIATRGKCGKLTILI